jgi:DNA mismatch repair protein MutS
MLRQYLDAKHEHPDCILFFRMGDFYEVFFEDAHTCHRDLGITLTSRNKDSEDAIPMAGVPHHAAEGYIRELVARGHHVAICEQLEDPAAAKGIVRRGVVRIVTPGVVLDEKALEAKANNFFVAVATSHLTKGETWGLSIVDASTGEWRLMEVVSTESLVTELRRLAPAELICLRSQQELLGGLLVPVEVPVCWRSLEHTDIDRVLARLGERRLEASENGLQVISLTPGEVKARWKSTEMFQFRERASVEAAAALALDYLSATQGGIPISLGTPGIWRPDDYLALDPASAANLEIFETLMGGRKSGSLFSVIDETVTAAGGRRLRTWLSYPLRSVERIRLRHQAVRILAQHLACRERLRATLRGMGDIQRMMGKLAAGQGNARDLMALCHTLNAIPTLRDELQHIAEGELTVLLEQLDPCADLVELIRRAIVDEPPLTTSEGGMIRSGFNAELDEIVRISTHGKEWMMNYEQQERARTRIASLKVSYTRVFGYYIEVTRANVENVPADYLRKQTLANAERYFTPELKEFEDTILNAEQKRAVLEARLFEEVRRTVVNHLARLRLTSERVADLDAYAALAHLANTRSYVEPVMSDEPGLYVREGRHPVVERVVEGGRFVPNDLEMSPESRLFVITGPNMAGKSTAIRQAALLVLLAQMGSFVPATEARIGVVDQIFSRVGASDNLARGQSTFMVEMSETAHILRHATERSLVILDEIGRGTSTYDGLSIAWAVAEHLHDEARSLTLFATHYHELTAISQQRDGARNLSVAVKEWNGNIIFLHKLVDGPANRSYGIQVARLAGVPESVVQRAREVLTTLEAVNDPATPQVAGLAGPRSPRKADPQLDLFGEPTRPSVGDDPLVQELEGLQIDHMTPVAALQWLHATQRRLKARVRRNQVG